MPVTRLEADLRRFGIIALCVTLLILGICVHMNDICPHEKPEPRMRFIKPTYNYDPLVPLLQEWLQEHPEAWLSLSKPFPLTLYRSFPDFVTTFTEDETQRIEALGSLGAHILWLFNHTNDMQVHCKGLERAYIEEAHKADLCLRHYERLMNPPTT